MTTEGLCISVHSDLAQHSVGSMQKPCGNRIFEFAKA
jgi:hypothetical protein